jgi:hypothetical protein
MALINVMNKYHISIHHAARLMWVPEQSIVRWLLEDKMSDLLEELFLDCRENELS